MSTCVSENKSVIVNDVQGHSKLITKLSLLFRCNCCKTKAAPFWSTAASVFAVCCALLSLPSRLHQGNCFEYINEDVVYPFWAFLKPLSSVNISWTWVWVTIRLSHPVLLHLRSLHTPFEHSPPIRCWNISSCAVGLRSAVTPHRTHISHIITIRFITSRWWVCVQRLISDRPSATGLYSIQLSFIYIGPNHNSLLKALKGAFLLTGLKLSY